MSTSKEREEAGQMLRRLGDMGIKAKLMQGDRCVLASMRLSDAPFRTLRGSVRIDQVMFAGVGRDRIKCVAPRPLFQLPMIHILDCRDSTEVEARIRLAWQRHVDELESTRAWLSAIGSAPELAEEGALLTLRLEGEQRAARAAVLDRRTAVIPGQGALSGIQLERREDRLLALDPTVRSGIDLSIAISTRIEELARLDHRLNDERRRAALEAGSDGALPIGPHRKVRLLLAGPTIAREQACIESLRMRGYVVDVATSEADALAIFDRCSPELAVADIDMGRNEGTDFVVSLRSVTGIEEIPVIVVDQTRHEQRREAARRVGAAGYLVYPIDVRRIAERLAQMVDEPRRRRYTRYHRRLPVEIHGAKQPGLVTSLGRGGMFVSTDESLEENTLQRCRLSLPELGTTVSLEAEVRYCRDHMGRTQGGVGVRFHAFEDRSENLLIDYLRTIDPAQGAAAHR